MSLCLRARYSEHKYSKKNWLSDFFVSFEVTTTNKKVKNDQHDETEKRQRYLDYREKLTAQKSELKDRKLVTIMQKSQVDIHF